MDIITQSYSQKCNIYSNFYTFTFLPLYHMEEIIAITEELYPTARAMIDIDAVNIDVFNPSSFPSSEQMGARIATGDFARMGRLLRAFIGLILRELVWKAIAMRKAGRNNQP